jgi:preprotein translocase subunit SecG
MIYLLIALHICVSLALIVIVLLQSGKGAEMGASFGSGGSQSVFGAGGSNTFMSKLTTSAAIIFMLTSLTLAYLGGKSGSSSIMPTKSPAAKPAPAAPMGGAPGMPLPQGATAPAQKSAPVKPAAPAAPAPAQPVQQKK